MTDTLNISIVPEPPKEFIRGQTLEFIMELPQTIPAYFFKTTNVTTMFKSQLRPAEDANEDNIICELNVAFDLLLDPNGTILRFTCPEGTDTSEWPLGMVEFDVLFTKTTTVSPGVATIKEFRSLPVKFKIVDGVTRK